MANLFKQLKALQTNIFGGPGNTGETKPPATRVQDIDLQASPTGILQVVILLVCSTLLNLSPRCNNRIFRMVIIFYSMSTYKIRQNMNI